MVNNFFKEINRKTNQKIDFQNNRKGILAWDSLLSLILSTVALVILVGAIASIFLETPTNLKIAKDNADSIKEFVEYSSSGKYGKLDSCFNILRLHHLENFQFAEGDDNSKNYFYVIDSTHIYVIPFKYKDKFYDDKNPRVLAVYDVELDLKSGVDINFDKTDQGSWYSGEIDIIPFLITISFGQSDERLSIASPAEFIVLLPHISDGSFVDEKVSKIFFESYSQNRFDSEVVFSNGDEKSVDANYLVYRNQDNKLFVSGGVVSDMIIDKYLCSFLYLDKKDAYVWLTQKDANGDFTNLDEIPYTNNRVVLSYKFDNNGIASYHVNSFVWDSEPKCFDSDVEIDCTSVFENFDCEMKFVDFMDMAGAFFKDAKLDDGEFKISLEELTLDEIAEGDVNVDFADVFDLYVDDSGKSINVYAIDSDAKEEYVYSFASWWGNNLMFNGKEAAFSNDFAYVNGMAYFYVSGSENDAKYYFFKSNWIQKNDVGEKETEFYFKGKKIEDSKRFEVDKYGISIPIFQSDDNEYFYWLKVPVEDKEYDVILTGTQISRILPVKVN